MMEQLEFSRLLEPAFAGATRIGVWVVAAMLWLPVAQSAALFDPTRPSDEWLAVNPPKVSAEEPGAALQLLRVDRTSQYAIINGQMVKAGDNYGGGKVVAVRSDEVVLQNGDEKQSLRLNPDIKKTVLVPESSPKPAKAGDGKKRSGKHNSSSKANK